MDERGPHLFLRIWIRRNSYGNLIVLAWLLIFRTESVLIIFFISQNFLFPTRIITHGLISTCLGFGILYPSWSFWAILRAFISGYGDPPGKNEAMLARRVHNGKKCFSVLAKTRVVYAIWKKLILIQTGKPLLWVLERFVPYKNSTQYYLKR